MATVTLELQLDEETAARLADPGRLASITELVKFALRPKEGPDPLIALFEQTSREAAAAGLTDAEIDAELAAWKAERSA
jgi:hypothetical protein